MAEINIGDVVQLRSGGLKMTLQEDRRAAGEGFLCAWFDGSTLNQKCIPEVVLRRAGPSAARRAVPIGAGIACLLLLLGVIVIIRDRKGEEVFRIEIPDDTSVEVRPVAPPPIKPPKAAVGAADR